MQDIVTRALSPVSPVSCLSIEFDRDETGWHVTHYGADITLRLRIQPNRVGDADCADSFSFEVKLPEAEAFVLIGEAVLSAYSFSPEGQEALSGIEDFQDQIGVGALHTIPCVCDLPTCYRSAFVGLLCRWGTLKTMGMVASTVDGTPINTQRGTCPRCGWSR